MGQAARAPSGPAEPGQRIAHYEILAEVGRGGMGVIYRARDLTLGRHVALKCPWPPDADARQRSRFMREARATSRLSHPNIVPLFEVFEEGGIPWLAMELVEGASLRSLVAHDRPLPIAEVLRHAEGLAGALQAAHDRNILHRDVNPNNIMVTTDGRALLTDFGLAQFVRKSDLSSTESRDPDVDAAGRVVGTPHYMSPEQALGKPLDRRSDIFALGAVIYEMCTGRQAFPGSGGDVMDAILHREPSSASRLNYEVPEELERIVRKALAKNPDDRHQDARDLLVDLRALRRRTEQGSDSAEPPRDPGPRRMRWLVGLGAALALASLVFAIARKRAPSASPVASHMRVAVLPHMALAERPANAGWPELIQALYVRELTGVQDLGVLDPMSVNGLLEAQLGTRQPQRAPGLYAALARARLTFVIDGTFGPAADGTRIQTNLVEPATGEVRFSSDAVVRREDDLPDAVAGLSRQVLAFLQLEGLAASQEKDLRPWMAHRARNLEALRAFVHASEYAMRHQPGAGRFLQQAIELDPSFVAPRVWLVSGLLAAGQHEKAQEHYRHLRGLEAGASPFEQAMIGWAGAAIAGNTVEQVRHLSVALSYSPDNNILLVNLAEAQFRNGAFDAALAPVAQPIAAGWSYPGLHSFEAECLLALGRYAEAEKRLTASLPTAPEDPDAHAILSVLALKKGDEAGAARHREAYLVGSRESGQPAGAAWDGLAAHLLLAGLYRPGADAVKAALADGGGQLDPPSFWPKALFATAKGVGMASACAAELERDPAWAAGRLALARIAEVRGARDEARGHYESFVRMDPRSAAAAGAKKRALALRAEPAAVTRR